jgi:Tfp pilus assembly pilus retraction ATPase PilT
VREGSQTLERSLNQLVRAGMISEREARGHSLHPADIHETV